MWCFTVIGVISFLLGLFFIVNPGLIKKIDGIGTKILLTSEQFIKNRNLAALFFCVAGAALIVVGLLY